MRREGDPDFSSMEAWAHGTHLTGLCFDTEVAGLRPETANSEARLGDVLPATPLTVHLGNAANRASLAALAMGANCLQ